MAIPTPWDAEIAVLIVEGVRFHFRTPRQRERYARQFLAEGYRRGWADALARVHAYRFACCGGSPVSELPDARCAKCGKGGPWVCACGEEYKETA